MLVRIAASYEADPAWREDLVQEISLALWKALPSFRGEAGLRTYAARIAHNRSVDHILRRKRVKERASLDTDAITETVPGQQEKLHRKMDLATAMRRMPLGYRQVLSLMLEGFRQSEIAQALGLEENTVAQRMSRGRQKLKQAMGESP
jgi:RNA polymerase sigma-70 factor (ECF subfamily)